MFTSILSSIIIWSAVLIIALRVVTNSGIQVTKVLHQIMKPQKRIYYAYFFWHFLSEL